jgi:chromosome segregation ATPase
VSVSVAAWCSQQLRAYSLQHQLLQEVGRLAARQGQLQQQTQELQEALGHSGNSSGGGTEGLRQGLEDELDAAAMELSHVGRQLQEAQQQLAAAQQAAEELQAQAGELQEGDVRLLLQRMLQQLVEQSMRNKQTRAQVRGGGTRCIKVAFQHNTHIVSPALSQNALCAGYLTQSFRTHMS